MICQILKRSSFWKCRCYELSPGRKFGSLKRVSYMSDRHDKCCFWNGRWCSRVLYYASSLQIQHCLLRIISRHRLHRTNTVQYLNVFWKILFPFFLLVRIFLLLLLVKCFPSCKLVNVPENRCDCGKVGTVFGANIFYTQDLSGVMGVKHCDNI